MNKINNILFVCTGNTCRSSMAEAIFKKMLQDKDFQQIEVTSAGISVFSVSTASPNAINVMKSKGIDMSAHLSKQITESMINEASIVLTMTRQHRDFVKGMFPFYFDKVFTLKEYAQKDKMDEINDLDITDPYGFSIEMYHKCAHEIELCLELIFNDINKE